MKNKQIAVIGLGKMGSGIAAHLIEKDWEVHVYNRTAQVATDFARMNGSKLLNAISEIRTALPAPRLVWVMLTAGEATDTMILQLKNVLEPGDYLIDGGNSNYKHTASLARELEPAGIRFMDCGTSGGPYGARNGACLMVGGQQDDFNFLRPLYEDLALPDAVRFFQGHGAGHFVKMVHNGIEYGMMQAIAEGMNILKASEYQIDVSKAAEIYNNGSVITSKLTDWLLKAYQAYGNELEPVSGTVDHLGEGEWTVEAAKEMGIPAEIISGSLEFRKRSQLNPTYTGKILTALRNQFGGHALN